MHVSLQSLHGETMQSVRVAQGSFATFSTALRDIARRVALSSSCGIGFIVPSTMALPTTASCTSLGVALG